MVKKTISTKSKVAVGAGLAAIAVAGVAGAYFLYGKDGAKNRKKVKSWAIMCKRRSSRKTRKAQRYK
jgi:hypothetical protein